MDLLVGDFFVVASPNGRAAMIIKVPLDATRGDLHLVLERVTGLDFTGRTSPDYWTSTPRPTFTVTWHGDPVVEGWNPFVHDVPLVDHGLSVGKLLTVRSTLVNRPAEDDSELADNTMLVSTMPGGSSPLAHAILRARDRVASGSGPTGATPEAGFSGVILDQLGTTQWWLPGMTEEEFRTRIENRDALRRMRASESLQWHKAD